MGLKPTKRKGSPYYQITGSIKGFGRVRESTGTDSLKEAKEIAFQLEKKIRDNLGSFEYTVSHAIVEYIEHTGNKDHLRKINEVLGSYKLSEINQGVLDRAARKAYPEYKKGDKGQVWKYKPSSINRMFYARVAAVLHYAHDIGWMPYIRVKLLRVRRPPPKWANKEWFTAFFKVASPELRAMVIFLSGTGCRASEALNLRPCDIDMIKSVAMVRTTKNGLPREAYMPNYVLQAITPYLTGERVFDMYKTRHSINSELQRSADKAGIEYLSTHKVGSHTFATNLASLAGMDAKALTETGRWKDPKSTHHYVHFLKREQASKADILEGLVVTDL